MKYLLKAGFALTAALVGGCAFAEDISCKNTTTGWNQMHGTDIELLLTSGERLPLSVRIADEPSEQMAGYQWLCPHASVNTAVLFVFDRPFTSSFHMRNVFTPLQIYYFDEKGVLINSLAMAAEAGSLKSGNAPAYYKAGGPMQFALEVPVASIIANPALEEIQALVLQR